MSEFRFLNNPSALAEARHELKRLADGVGAIPTAIGRDRDPHQVQPSGPVAAQARAGQDQARELGRLATAVGNVAGALWWVGWAIVAAAVVLNA